MSARWQDTNRAISDRRRDYGPEGCAEDFALVALAVVLVAPLLGLIGRGPKATNTETTKGEL